MTLYLGLYGFYFTDILFIYYVYYYKQYRLSIYI